MPRSGRGGARVGKVGQSYAQRTDLAGGSRLPVQAPKSTSYGSAAASVAAQKTVPLASPSPGPAPAGGPAGAAGAAVTPSPAAPAPAPPGAFGDPLRPTENPAEPVTAGLPFGPGPGPSQPSTPSPLLSALASLNAAGGKVSPVVAAVRNQANAYNAAGLNG